MSKPSQFPNVLSMRFADGDPKKRKRHIFLLCVPEKEAQSYKKNKKAAIPVINVKRK